MKKTAARTKRRPSHRHPLRLAAPSRPHNRAVRSRLTPIKARVIRRRFENIGIYISTRTVNAASESINSKMQREVYSPLIP